MGTKKIMQIIWEQRLIRHRKCCESNVILIHPETYELLNKQVIKMNPGLNGSIITECFGIKVKRCIDIKKNEIEIY